MVDWQCIFCCCSFETQMLSSKRRWKAIISEMVCDWKNRSCWSDCWLIWMHYGLALLFKKRIIIIITRETIRESHNDQIILFYIFLIFFIFILCMDVGIFIWFSFPMCAATLIPLVFIVMDLLFLLHYIIIVWMAENNDVEIHMYSMWNESSNRNPFRCFCFFFSCKNNTNSNNIKSNEQ